MSMQTFRHSDEQAILAECQAAIGYSFRDVMLLRAALTHTSGANTRGASNERMEFLGDSVLGLVTCTILYEKFPNYQEGDLTKVKSVLVSRKTCARFSIELGLGDFLFFGKGMDRVAVIPANILADVFESLVAAIYLDGGWEIAQEFVLRFVVPELERVAQKAVASNSKSILQQVAQREFGDVPRYRILDEQGPDHDKCFKIAVVIAGHSFPPAWGRNKKDAELLAATNALQAIEPDRVPLQ